MPTVFSAENDMDPGDVPPELRELRGFIQVEQGDADRQGLPYYEDSSSQRGPNRVPESCCQRRKGAKAMLTNPPWQEVGLVNAIRREVVDIGYAADKPASAPPVHTVVRLHRYTAPP